MRRVIPILLACLSATAVRSDEPGGLLGGVVRAQRKAKDTECLMTLKEIGTAIHLHDAIFQRMPDRLSDLVACGRVGLSLQQLYCPLHGRDEAAKAFAGMVDPKAGQIDAAKVRAHVRAHPPSYAKIPGPIPLDAVDPASRVIVYEKAPCRNGERHVGFLDGHVETVSEERFQELAKAQGFLKPPAPRRERRELTPDLASEIDRTIAELSAESFDAREAAAKRLAEIGPVAEEALKKAAASPELETRTRAAQILAAFQEEELE